MTFRRVPVIATIITVITAIVGKVNGFPGDLNKYNNGAHLLSCDCVSPADKCSRVFVSTDDRANT